MKIVQKQKQTNHDPEGEANNTEIYLTILKIKARRIEIYTVLYGEEIGKEKWFYIFSNTTL